jgi:hypothetical protein
MNDESIKKIFQNKKAISNMLKFIRDNFVWVKDVSIVLFMAAILYLNSHFVTIEKFEAYQHANDLAHQAIQTTLVSVDKTLALMQQNQTLLTDNQKQITINTAKIVETDLRVKSLENLNVDDFMKESAINRKELDIRLKSLEAIHQPK